MLESLERVAHFNFICCTLLVRGLSGQHPSILNISKSRSRRLDLTWQSFTGELSAHPWTVTIPCDMSVGSERTLTELVYCVTFAFTNHHLSTAILALGKARSRREPKLDCRGLTDLGDMTFCQKRLNESCRVGRLIVVMKLICSIGHFEKEGHTVHKLSQRRLTADWLVPRKSDCSRMNSKVSSHWLPSYIKATRSVLEIFIMDRYFPDSPCKTYSAFENTWDILNNSSVDVLCSTSYRCLSTWSSSKCWHT